MTLAICLAVPNFLTARSATAQTVAEPAASTAVPHAADAPWRQASSAGSTRGAASSTGDASMDPRIFTFGTIAVGGEFDGEAESDAIGSGDLETEMEPTYGFGVHVGIPIHRYVTLGSRATFFWWVTEADEEQGLARFKSLNVDVAPKLRFPFAGGAAEVYAAVPVGPTINFPNKDLEDETEKSGGPGVEVTVPTTVSWNISILGGASYRFTPAFGVFVEAGWYHQYLKQVIEAEGPRGSIEANITGSFDQFATVGGLLFSF